jgi:hypothetical protein
MQFPSSSRIPYNPINQKWLEWLLYINNLLQEKAVKATSEKKKRGKNLSPRNRTKACHSVGTALLKSVAEIGTQSAMKSSRKTLHGLSPHIPQKTPKRNISRSTNKMLHTVINVIA